MVVLILYTRPGACAYLGFLFRSKTSSASHTRRKIELVRFSHKMCWCLIFPGEFTQVEVGVPLCWLSNQVRLMSFRIFRKDLESCKIRLVCGQLTLGDPILCSGVTMECDLSTDDLLDEHLGLNDDVTLLFFSRHPVTVMDRWSFC